METSQPTVSNEAEVKTAWCNCGTKTPQGQHHQPGCPAHEAYLATQLARSSK